MCEILVSRITRKVPPLAAPGTSAAGPIDSFGSVAIEPLCTRSASLPPSVPLFSLHAPITTSSASAPPAAAALFRRMCALLPYLEPRQTT